MQSWIHIVAGTLVCIGGIACTVPQSVPGPNSSTEARIAFVRNRQIWVMDADGRNAKQLTTVAPDHGNVLPSISPNGRTVAFLRDAKHQHFEIHIVEVDRGEASVKRITSAIAGEGMFDSRPMWSPDGTLLAARRASGHLWITRLADGKAQRLNRDQEVNEAPWASELNGLSPDGRWEAWLSAHAPERGAVYKLMVGKVGAPQSDGRELAPRVLAPHSNKKGGADVTSAFRWSPDSRSIFYFAAANDKWALFRVDVRSTESRLLAEDVYDFSVWPHR